MKKRPVRLIGLLLCVFSVLRLSFLPVLAANPAGAEQLITYKNTGNQRLDMIGVALTQVGYMEKPVNDTIYGDWYCLPEQEWCAMFVSWCARQAEVSTDIISTTAWAHPNTFKIPCYPGTEYTPQPGDIFFTEDFTHTGIVWYVEGDFFYCIEGNARYHDYTLPPDPSIDSYHVMTNKRLISAHSFGVPDYEGCDKAHTYVRAHDNSHPHRAYFQCSTCGDKYYTGYTDCVAGCSSCFSCGCDSRKAGYYVVDPDLEYLRLSKGHTNNKMPNYVTTGSVVYVYGISASGWAYIDYYGLRGHIPAEFLTKYQDAPTDTPAPTVSKTDWLSSQVVDIQWEPVARAETYRLQLYRDGTLYQDTYLSQDPTCRLSDLPKGSYEAQLRACNRVGQSDAGSVRFTVRDYFYLTYDRTEGTGYPEDQTHPIAEALTLSQTLPTRDGYTCLGWSADPDNFASYFPGGSLTSHKDLCLYPVWKEAAAVPASLAVETDPQQTEYYPEDPLNTEGLTLRYTYSDGSGYLVTDGFTVEGFSSEAPGQVTLTISWEGLTTTCQVTVKPLPPGDLNDDRQVDRDDVIRLLWHINFPSRFPIDDPADFDGNSRVDRDDVIRLLWHINFPDRFPLEITQTEEDTAL